MKALGVLFACLCAAPAIAIDFSARRIDLPLQGSSLLGQPLPATAGDILLLEWDFANNARRLRFGEDGQWKGVLPHTRVPGNGNSLTALANGDYLTSGDAVFSSACDVKALHMDFSLKWRHTSMFEEGHDGPPVLPCGMFASDGTGRVWYSGTHFGIGHLHDDGSPAATLDRYDLPQPHQDSVPGVMATFADRAGAVFALHQYFESKTTMLLALEPSMLVRWQHMPVHLTDEEIRFEALHVDDDGGVTAIGSSKLPGDVTAKVYATRLNANGAALWTRRFPDLEIIDVLASKRFRDGTMGVFYRAPPVTHNRFVEFRIAVIDRNGNIERALAAEWDVLFSDVPPLFVEPAPGRRALLANGGDEQAIVWNIDGDGLRHPLGIGRYLGAIERSDRNALVFASALPEQAMLYDGAANDRRIPFVAPTALHAVPFLDRKQRLANGDYLSVGYGDGANWLRRIDAGGNVIWSSRLDDGVGQLQTLRQGSAWLPVGEHSTCLLLGYYPDLECFDNANGDRRFERDLPEVRGAVSSAAGVDLVVLDNANLQHWRVDIAGAITANHGLSTGELALIQPGFALARSNTDPAQLTASDIAWSDPITMPAPADSPLANVEFAHNFGTHQYLTLEQLRAPNGSTTVRVRRVTGSTVLWTRVLEADSSFGYYVGPHGLLHASTERVHLLVRGRSGKKEIHFLDATDGTQTQPPVLVKDDYANHRVHVDAQSEGVVVWSTQAGTVVLRPFARDGTPLATGSWRCPSDCTLADTGVVAGTAHSLITSGDSPGDRALIALTATNAFQPRAAPRLGTGAFSGVFIATNESNRGYVIDYLPSSGTFFAARFAGDTSGSTDLRRLDWETLQGPVIADADTVTVTRYSHDGGRFANDQDAYTQELGTATFRFDGCDRAELILNDSSHSEVVHLVRSGPRLQPCLLRDGRVLPAQTERPARGGFDARQSGAWVASGTRDQGLLLTVLPATTGDDGVLFAPWFTYWPGLYENFHSGNRHWLTLQGTLTPSTTGSVELTIYRATAGSYGPIRPSNTYRVGTATWTLTDCEHATLSYQFDADASAQPYSGRSGVQNYARPGACSGGP
jgi:hypothetical protein